ncbi:isochorismate synthase [Vibrio aestuarianus]|uniref:Isochorismate synthase MenF n=1 Tax=Vibrio aestuarianus TaxID=28171 RepID=A0A9X4F803_9VIBR|nr:isochorismate synthase MenF [Vibrio aestuarianus]MDE1236792.1 isochorismate synthase MenF [Vibrio aestuarianus]MDE1247657.1 isochorismate synthase MenF [Vibrio aestuarianus]MDE1346766.1 isochorismate synthase MenF [Vibrio aestuarianus]NGZ64816.1 isochorismate synthase MenF [Vibrio aestuarianus subsp. cardii]NGZ67270.1 isochorismate synthase MenF [Vibrio aestuarianus subsp. cardii]
MSHFHQAIALLIEQINDAKDDDVRFVQNLQEAPPFASIDWLEAQPIFPKFYWQSRDTREEVVALGQLYTFCEPEPAYTILGAEQRVWGGRSFDGHTDKNKRCMSSFFFLPQIELMRLDEQWSIAVNVTAERHRTLAALSKLQMDVSPLRSISSHIECIKHEPNENQWQQLVDQVLNGIGDNAFKKVVLARKTTLNLDSPISAAQLLRASSTQNHNSFHFLLALDQKHSFMGSTPERLYARQGNELYTEALAGTIGRGMNASQDMELANWLSQDSKNLNENQYVVDDIVERLTPHSECVEVEEEARLVRLRKVQHLKRSIHAQLKKGINGVQLLSALQPTAAVAGLPRKEAMDFILAHEPFARGWYAGSVGYISHQKAEFCVAIRSALLVDKQVQLFAGAGIVPGSVAEHEWQELDKKMSTLLSLISDHLPLGVAS